MILTRSNRHNHQTQQSGKQVCLGALWPGLACFGWLMFCQTLPRQAQRWRDEPWGPESPWSHYQALESHTMYKHLQGTGSVPNRLLENTHTYTCQSFFLKRQWKCFIENDASLNTALIMHLSTKRIGAWCLQATFSMHTIVCELSHSSEMNKNTVKKSFSIFLWYGLRSRAIRFHEKGDLIERFIPWNTEHELLYDSQQKSLHFPRSNSCASHHCKPEVCTTAKEKEISSSPACKLFDANLKQNWELQ